MQVQIYKPNSKSTGAAARFQISSKPNQEPVFYVNVIKQFSWNDADKTGSFKENQKNPKNTIALKFNELELGELINTFRTGNPYSTFHTGVSKTGINLTTWKKLRYKDKPLQHETTAFSLSLVRDGADKFSVTIEAGEAVRLTALFYKFFDVLDSYRKDQFDNYKAPAKTNTKPQEDDEPPQAEEDAPTEEEDGPGF